MSSRAKIVIGVGCLLVVLLAGGVIAASKVKKAVEVRIEPVERRDLVASVTASGAVVPRVRVDVSTDISGRIINLAVKEGQMVTKGQLLLQIDPAIYQAAVDHDKAALAGAKAGAVQADANEVQAQRNYERFFKIKQANAALLSDQDLENYKTTLDVNKATANAAHFQVAQAEAQLHNSQSALDKTTVLAPMTGRVTRLPVQQGETAIQGTLNKDAATLLTISDMTILDTKIKVDETDVAHIQVGDTALVQLDAFPDTVFRGRVYKIANSSVKAANASSSTTTTTTDQAVDYEVTVQLLNAPVDTRPDFSATAKIITDTRTHALSIPIIALTVRENEALPAGDSAISLGRSSTPTKQVGKKDVEGVFVVGPDNRVTFRPVKVGIAGDKYFEVLDGVRERERIVGGTYQAIRDLKDSTLVKQAKPTPGTPAGPAKT
ncbi:MAG TPA: efflux RND transporter periplasmic adaptor subunit [Gemmatimonadaceae bacterium]|jgi:HlyD family secretion protein|nr:efflux RND transporter periplasmic adaptor subunit [Gemmatimonadaceae bacterium]